MPLGNVCKSITWCDTDIHSFKINNSMKSGIWQKYCQRRKYMIKKEYLMFLPLLTLYLFLVVVLSSNTFQSDEEAYVRYADHLSEGTHSSNSDEDLWFGPGYPMVLTPFVYWELPLLTAKLLNPFFLFGAILYFYKTLSLYIKKDFAIISTYCFGIYPPLLREIYLLMTENLVFFLICGFVFHFCKLYQEFKMNWLHLLAASLYLGSLALTKVFFGYVIPVGVLLYLFLFVRLGKEKYIRATLVCVLALICCLPYLFVTYSLTGKPFYWGSSGGLSLFWMSTPYNGEMGDWFSAKDVNERPELSQHRTFFDQVAELSEVEKDDIFKNQAKYNIINYPMKYAANWVANIGRLLFSYPFSYTPQKLETYFYMVPNMFIIVLFVLSVFPAILRYKVIPDEIHALIVFAFITLAGTSLLSAYDRQFRPMVPIILLWLSFIYFRVLKIELRPDNEIQSAITTKNNLGDDSMVPPLAK
jgi:hypothetical protein